MQCCVFDNNLDGFPSGVFVIACIMAQMCVEYVANIDVGERKIKDGCDGEGRGRGGRGLREGGRRRGADEKVEVCSAKVASEADEDVLVGAGLYLLRGADVDGVGDVVRQCGQVESGWVEVGVTDCRRRLGSKRGWHNDDAQVTVDDGGMGTR